MIIAITERIKCPLNAPMCPKKDISFSSMLYLIAIFIRAKLQLIYKKIRLLIETSTCYFVKYEKRKLLSFKLI